MTSSDAPRREPSGSSRVERPTPTVARYRSRAHRAARFVAQRVALAAVVHSVVTVCRRGVDVLDDPTVRADLADGYVLVSNHTSHLDAALITTQLPWAVTKHLAFGAAADYFFTRSWRRWAAGLFFNTFPIDRQGSGSARGMAFLLVDAGVPIMIFPEGTRSRTGELGTFNPGAALVARRERVPCVPVAVRGAHEAMPPGRSFWPRWGRPPVEIVVGAPIRARRGERIPDFADRIEVAVRHMVTTGEPHTEQSADAPAARAEAPTDAANVPTARTDTVPAPTDAAPARPGGAQ